MVALCHAHADAADSGAYTVDQLRDLKAKAAQRAIEVRGHFEWMRRSLVAIVGGNFYIDVPILIEFKGEPMLWFNRDEDGYLLLNVRMLSGSGEPRMRLEDNFWITRGAPSDLECPPGGKRLKATYENGDSLEVIFGELANREVTQERSAILATALNEHLYPVTTVEIRMDVGGTPYRLSATESTLGGLTMSGNVFSGGRVGVSFD